MGTFKEDAMETDPTVDVAFPATGGPLPLDHGYALFGAIARIVPRVHEASNWGIHPVRGRRAGPGELLLDDSSLVKLRIPASEIAAVLPLAGAGLEVDGGALRLGVPRIYALVPSPVLRSRFVTVRGFFEEPAAFEGAVRRQLATIELGQDPERVGITVGERRVMRIKEKTIVGFALLVEGLDGDASIALQVAGLGGRRHMGAGVFVPPGRRG